jgi:hypothetical protein
LNHLLIPVDSKIPNLALMKVSAYLKAKGHHVDLRYPTVAPDEVWISCQFTWEKDHALEVGHFMEASYRAKVHYGGTAFDWGLPRDERIELPAEIEATAPDYGLYDDDRAVGFCQRGCNRKCQFCDVWRKEGRIPDNKYQRITKWVPDGFSKVLLLDNDMALYDDKQHDEILYDCRQSGRKLSITQGYDIRCMTSERAAQLAEDKPWDLKFQRRSLYIAWDYLGIEPAVRKGIEMLTDAGFRGAEIMCYTVVGFNSTMEENLHRYEVLWEEYGVYPFVMVYNNRRDLLPERAFARWVNRRIHKNHSWESFRQNPEYEEDIDPQQAGLEAVEPSKPADTAAP